MKLAVKIICAKCEREGRELVFDDLCYTCNQEECPHDERDHGICLDCEHEEDPGKAIDDAELYLGYER